MKSPRLIVITDPAYPVEHTLKVVELVGRTTEPGALGVQLRDTSRTMEELRPIAHALRDVTARVGAQFLVNRHVELAREVGADGVHLPEGAGTPADVRDVMGAGTWVSMAAHSDAAVVFAMAARADAVVVSPIFDTPGKMPARGVAAIRSARARLSSRVAVVALGGVTRENARDCFEAGADAVAVIRAIFDAEDPCAVARDLHIWLPRPKWGDKTI